MFQPSINVSNATKKDMSALIKSVLELIRMKNEYQEVKEENSTQFDSTQLELVQILLSKVVEESCNWVRIPL